MTKRVLSLLLALVMALSLCVPAFAAEAPVDEAEEVGAEVVDAPAEVAVDEPAEVAVDEPATIDVLDRNVLQSVVDQANKMKPGVVAGNYQDEAVNWPDDRGDMPGEETGDCAADASKYFLNRLDAAELILAEIAHAGNHDVWFSDASNVTRYQDAVAHLTTAINLVTEYVRDGAAPKHDQVKQLNDMLSWCQGIIDQNHDEDIGYGLSTYDTQPWFETEVKDLQAFLKGMAGYTKDGFTTKALYKDYKAAKTTYDRLFKEWNYGTAQLPEYTDYIEVRDTIDHTRAKLASCDYFDLAEYPDDTKKVGVFNTLEDFMEAIEDRMTGVGTGFEADVKLVDVHRWLNTINAYLQKDNHSLKLDYFFINTDYLSVWAAVTDASGWKTDSHHYYIEISSTAKTVKGGKIMAYWLNNGQKGVDYGGLGATATELGIADGENRLINGSVITAKLICADCGKEIDSTSVTVNDDYNGPEITSATYAPDAITVKLNKSMNHSSGSQPGTSSDHNQYKAATLTLKYNGTVVETKNVTGYDTVFTFNLKPVKLGDYTVELQVKEGKPSGYSDTWKSRGTKTVTVPDITAYVGKAGTDETWGLAGATGYANLQLAISSASKTENLIAISGDTKTLVQQLTDNVAEAQAIVDIAKTLPDSIANRKKVDVAIQALYAILKNFDKAADATALTDAIKAAEAMVATDYDSVTLWGELQDALKAGKAIKLPLGNTDANKQKIAAAAAAIEDAIDALTLNHIIHPDTELASLKALIDGVPARLAADDYSAESKAAVNAAVAAAQPLLTKKGVLKSEVNAAIAVLEDALNNLTTVKSDAIPACPVGNGWAQAENGDYYYYDKNGKLVVNDWVSSKGLWYHMGATGKMDTGFIHIVDKWGDAWYYLNPSNTKGTMGRMFTGWKMINDSSAGAWGWFETRNNGHQGQCTYTTNWGDFKNYKPF